MASNPYPTNNLGAALLNLQFDSFKKLKQEFILKPNFLGPWKTFRDNVIWTTSGPGCAGQKFKSIVEKIAAEINKREMSTYIALEGEHIDISDYTVQDHLIRLVVSVAVATKRARILQVAGPKMEACQFAMGTLFLAKELSYQYLPTVSGRLAQEVDKATGPSIHKQAQDVLYNIDNLGEEEDVISSAIQRDLQIQRSIEDKLHADDSEDDGPELMPWISLAKDAAQTEASAFFEQHRLEHRRRSLRAKIDAARSEIDEAKEAVGKVESGAMHGMLSGAMGPCMTEALLEGALMAYRAVRDEYAELFGEDEFLASYPQTITGNARPQSESMWW